AARRQGRPSRPIQDSMVTLETLLLAQSHHTQGGGHGAFAGRQNRSDHQDFGVLPNGLGEQGRKLYNQRQQLGRQCQQLKTSRRKSGFQVMRPAVIFSKIKNGQSRAKRFIQQKDEAEAHGEYSVVYTIVVRVIATDLAPEMMADLQRRGGIRMMPLTPPTSAADFSPESCPPRNISPLWSQRPSRQSGFGLLGIGPNEEDAWGSVLGIVEHRFHPTFSPDGWNRIGGPDLFIDGTQYSWEDDMSSLAQHILPEDNELISQIRRSVAHVLQRFRLE